MLKGRSIGPPAWLWDEFLDKPHALHGVMHMAHYRHEHSLVRCLVHILHFFREQTCRLDGPNQTLIVNGVSK
jgi:hypothetical protein